MELFPLSSAFISLCFSPLQGVPLLFSHSLCGQHMKPCLTVPPSETSGTITFEGGSSETFDFVFGADGVGSVVRDALERAGELRVKRYEDDNIRLYKTIPGGSPPVAHLSPQSPIFGMALNSGVKEKFGPRIKYPSRAATQK